MTLLDVRFLLARARRWVGIHVFGGMPVLPRLKAWRLGRKGDGTAAAMIWRGLAQAAPQAQAAAIGWIQFARYCLALGRLVEAKKALERALAARPHDHTARVLLAEVATAQQDWRKAAKYWRNALEGEMSPPEAATAVGHLIYALTSQGAFTEAAAAIERYAASGALSAADAMQCRLALAEKQPDRDSATVWRKFYDRFPQAATDSPDWLRFAGGMEQQSIVEHTTAELATTTDARAAQRILSFLELRLSAAEYMTLARATARRFPDSAALQALYFWRLRYGLSCADDLAALQAIARDFGARFPGHAGWRLAAAAAVATNDTAAIARLAHATGWESLQIRLAAAQGEHEKAKAISRRMRGKNYYLAEDGNGLDLRPINAEPRQAFTDKILLFTALRDEMLFLPWFLDYYRALGVDWFFIIDNGSTDGGAAYLAAQKDVALFASADNYAAAACGMRWVNELIRRYGQDNWCVHVDADEQFIAPGIETRGLRGVVDGMAARGEEVMPAYTLDTYPADMVALRDFKPGDSPLAVSSLIDPEYFFFGGHECCFFRAQGGARRRLFDTREMLEKAPILRGGGERFYHNASHTTSYGRVSAQCGVLLHHKILREALDVIKPRADAASRIHDRGAACRIRHARYRDSGLLDGRARLPRGARTVAYTDSDQLARFGLIGDFAAVTAKRRED